MSQSRRASLVEATTNTAAGFIISLLAWRYLTAPATQTYIAAGGAMDDWLVAAVSTGFYTVLSVARNYATRRFFNWRQK